MYFGSHGRRDFVAKQGGRGVSSLPHFGLRPFGCRVHAGSRFHKTAAILDEESQEPIISANENGRPGNSGVGGFTEMPTTMDERRAAATERSAWLPLRAAWRVRPITAGNGNSCSGVLAFDAAPVGTAEKPTKDS
jgi:hypothetical protein